jgi:hypothetical protein
VTNQSDKTQQLPKLLKLNALAKSVYGEMRAEVGLSPVDAAAAGPFSFLSHTQRDPAAKLLATEIYEGFAKRQKPCWLDVKMDERDEAAMRAGVRDSEAFIAIVTGAKPDSYFSRQMCRQEITWAVEFGKPIVPVVATEDKSGIGAFIADGKRYGIDFSHLGARFSHSLDCVYCHYLM